MSSAQSPPRRSGKKKKVRGRLRGAGLLAQILLLAALLWGVGAVGATEVRLWAAAPFWWLSFGAGLMALCDRLARPQRAPALVGPARWPFLFGFLWIAWCVVGRPEHLDRWLFVKRLLSVTGAGALALAAFHLTGRTRKGYRPILWTLLGLGLVESVLTIFQGPNGAGTYANHAHLAGLLELLLPLSVALWLDESAGTGEKMLAGYGLGLGVVAVLIAQSRGGWLAAGFGLACVGVMVARERRVRTLAAVGLVIVLLGFGFAVGTAGDALEKRFATLAPESLEAEQYIRVHLWDASVKVFLDHPVTGVGLGNFIRAYPRYRMEGVVSSVRHSHNDYLQFLAETGAPGILLGLLAVGTLFLGLFRLARGDLRERRRRYLAACAASLLAFGAHSLVDFNAHIPVNLAIACVIGAMGLGLGIERERSQGDAAVGEAPPKEQRRTPVGALAGTVVGLLGLGWLCVQAIRYEQQLLIAQARLEEGLPLRALEPTETALRLVPIDPEAYRLRAEVHLAAQATVDGALAESHAREALASTRAVPRVAIPIARVRILESKALGKGPESMALLEQASRDGPNDPMILFAMASALAIDGQIDRAEDALRRSFEAYPPDRRPLHLVRALAPRLEQLGWVEEALPVGFSRGQMELAREYEERGQIDSARRLWVRARDQDPANLEVRARRGLFSLRTGDLAAARVDLEYVRLRESPPTSAVAGGLYQCYRGIGELDAADAVLEAGRAAWSDELTWWAWTAERQLEKELPKEALATYQTMAERFERAHDGPLGAARLLVRQGRRKGDRQILRAAARQYREAIRRAPKETVGRVELSDLYLELGDEDRAVVLLQALDDEVGLLGRGALTLGKVHLGAGRHRSAEGLFRRASETVPEARDWWLRALVARAVSTARSS